MKANGLNRRIWRTPAPRIAKPEPPPDMSGIAPIEDIPLLADIGSEKRDRAIEIRERIEEHISEWIGLLHSVRERQRRIEGIKFDIKASSERLALIDAELSLMATGSNQKARDADLLKLRDESVEYDNAAAAVHNAKWILSEEQAELQHDRDIISVHRARIASFTAEYGVVGEL